MNDTKTVKDETTAPASRRWLPGPITWFTAPLLGLAVWYFLPSSYRAGGIRFTTHSRGSPAVLTFDVRDPQGRPLPGVTVMSESYSGATKEFITDASGVAKIEPGESEVLAVNIAGHEFRLRPLGWIGEFFAPDCGNGLTFNVTILPKPAHFQRTTL